MGHGRRAGPACGVAVAAAAVATLVTVAALLGRAPRDLSAPEIQPPPATAQLLRSTPVLAVESSSGEGAYNASAGRYGEGTGVGVGAAGAEAEAAARQAWIEEPVSSLLAEVLSVVGPQEDEQEGGGGRALVVAEDGGGGGSDGGSGQGVVGGARRSLKGFQGHHRCFVDPQDKERCHANVFFFGISKCGAYRTVPSCTIDMILLYVRVFSFGVAKRGFGGPIRLLPYCCCCHEQSRLSTLRLGSHGRGKMLPRDRVFLATQNDHFLSAMFALQFERLPLDSCPPAICVVARSCARARCTRYCVRDSSICVCVCVCFAVYSGARGDSPRRPVVSGVRRRHGFCQKLNRMCVGVFLYMIYSGIQAAFEP